MNYILPVGRVVIRDVTYYRKRQFEFTDARPTIDLSFIDWQYRGQIRRRHVEYEVARRSV